MGVAVYKTIVAAICVLCEELSGRIKVTLHTVVCFVKVDRIDLNICVNNTLKRIVGGEDHNVLTSRAGSVSKHVNLVCFGAAVVVSLATVNVHDVSVGGINNLQELRAQLLCQQNAGSNNNSGGAVSDRIVTALSVKNHGKSLAAASRHKDLTLSITKHTIQDALLMWAKGDGQVLCLSQCGITI